MLKITADLFSGRPNRSWVVTDDQEARAILREAGDVTAQAVDASANGGLGLRGMVVEPLADDLGPGFAVDSPLYVPTGLAGGGRSRAAPWRNG